MPSVGIAAYAGSGASGGFRPSGLTLGPPARNGHCPAGNATRQSSPPTRPPMPLRKSHLYSSLWQSCDQLRGGMYASQYKDYVLTLLFMKYVSDKYAGSDDFADITVPPGGSFADMVALKGTKEIGDGINKVIGRLADANDYLLKGVIDQADFNDESKLGKGREMQDRLSKLVGIFEGLDFRANRAHGDDLLGDAYEYLMRHFATQSGKSKGQFYTPAEVSRIMAQVIGIGPDTRRDHTVYDPTCGSGSLLIKAADEAPHGLTVYGQEKDVATWTMARMNMILHGRVAAEIKPDNTLALEAFGNVSAARSQSLEELRLRSRDFHGLRAHSQLQALHELTKR